MKKYQQGGGTSYGQGSYYSPSFGSPYTQQTSQIQQQAGLQELIDQMEGYESKGELDLTKRKMTKEMQDKMEREMKKAQKKSKNIGLAGNVLGFGLNFVPGLQGWGASGVQSLVSGLQTKLQQEAMEKASKFNLGKGTFLESQGADYAKQVKEMAKGYDPLKAAATSMLGSGIGMGVQKGMEAAKAAKTAAELEKVGGAVEDVSKGVKTGKEVLSEEAWMKENYPDATSTTPEMAEEFGKYTQGAKETAKTAASEETAKAATGEVSDAPELTDPGAVQPKKQLGFESTGQEKADVFFGKAGTSADKWAQAQAWLTDPNMQSMLQGLLGEDEEGYASLISQLVGSFDPQGGQQ